MAQGTPLVVLFPLAAVYRQANTVLTWSAEVLGLLSVFVRDLLTSCTLFNPERNRRMFAGPRTRMDYTCERATPLTCQEIKSHVREYEH